MNPHLLSTVATTPCYNQAIYRKPSLFRDLCSPFIYKHRRSYILYIP